uniref:Uncharacterized protein n=1 Tax=Hyaloperonospora arabidopsidis (strain Emoy2) TaxID=559515 RepID=M4C6T2_HYAAE
MCSDDSSSAASRSIFSRLSNPTNFTGIHKNRVRESASKREVLHSRSERNRVRRLKDKGQLKSSKSLKASTEPFGGAPAGVKSPGSIKSNSVLEVLANLKRENEFEHHVNSSSSLRHPMSYITTDRPRDYSSDDKELAVSGVDAFSTIPPPPPQGDVYSRLAGQYTASAKGKRQPAAAATRREQADAGESSGKALLRRIEPEGNAHIVDQHGCNESADCIGSENESSYDPLLGGDSLIKQVHDDYQERIARRSADARSRLRTKD